MGTRGSDAAVRQNGLGWYVYGVVAAREAPAELEAVTAVDHAHEVILVREGPLAAVASKVSLQEFQEAKLRDLLNEPAWLEPKIRAHEQVLEAVLAAAAVVPFRFCTLYRSERELRRFLGERTDELGAALRRVEGKTEVGVKAFVARERFERALVARKDAARELKDRVAAAKGGREYLERRRLEQLVAQEMEGFKAETTQEIHARLRAVAEDGVLNPLQSPAATGRPDEMFMNAAYLVEDERELERAVAALASDHGELGVTLEVTGPWPPYNFVPRELGER